MRESKIEKAHVKKIKSQGGQSYKFVCPGRRNVPDRVDLLPISTATDRCIVSNYITFTETKATGKKPNSGQKREHERLRKLGFKVNVLDTI